MIKKYFTYCAAFVIMLVGCKQSPKFFKELEVVDTRTAPVILDIQKGTDFIGGSNGTGYGLSDLKTPLTESPIQYVEVANAANMTNITPTETNDTLLFWGQGQFMVLDIHDYKHPIVLNTFVVPAPFGYNVDYGLIPRIHRGRIFLRQTAALDITVYDIRTAGAGTHQLADFEVGKMVFMGGGTDVNILAFKDHFVLVRHNDNVIIRDIDIPDSQSNVSSLIGVHHLVAKDAHTFLSTTNNGIGLKAWNLSDINNPKIISEVTMEHGGMFFLHKDYVYVTDPASNTLILIYDVSDSKKMVLAGKLDLVDSAMRRMGFVSEYIVMRGIQVNAGGFSPTPLTLVVAGNHP